jgi:hypothetical protein
VPREANGACSEQNEVNAAGTVYRPPSALAGSDTHVAAAPDTSTLNDVQNLRRPTSASWLSFSSRQTHTGGLGGAVGGPVHSSHVGRQLPEHRVRQQPHGPSSGRALTCSMIALQPGSSLCAHVQSKHLRSRSPIGRCFAQYASRWRRTRWQSPHGIPAPTDHEALTASAGSGTSAPLGAMGEATVAATKAVSMICTRDGHPRAGEGCTGRARGSPTASSTTFFVLAQLVSASA